MAMDFFLRGLIIGFSIAAPLGPIGVLCIRRTLSEGRTTGFLSGLGAATADAVYSCIAGFGLVLISNALTGQQVLLRVVGGVFLSYLGVKAIVSRPCQAVRPDKRTTAISAYFSTFVLTIMNPMTVLSFTAIFAGLGVSSADYSSAATLVFGVFTGSASWWLVLSVGVGLIRANLDSSVFRCVNAVSGAVMLGFGLAALSGAGR